MVEPATGCGGGGAVDGVGGGGCGGGKGELGGAAQVGSAQRATRGELALIGWEEENVNMN